jgi:glutaredoxin
MKKRGTAYFITIIALLCCSAFAAEPRTRIRLYTMPRCGSCKRVKEDLTKHGINIKNDVEEIDVTRNRQASRKIKAVPVLEYGGIRIVGFGGPEYEKKFNALIKKYRLQTSQKTNGSAPVDGAVDVAVDGTVDVNSNPDPYLIPFRSKVENLETLFQNVQIYINEKGIRTQTGVRILKKCFEANLAKLVYEFCQSQDFAKAVEKGSLGTIAPEQIASVITAIQNIASMKYQIASAEFREVCSQKPEITSRTKNILKRATAQNNSYGFSSDELFNVGSGFIPPPQKQEKKAAKQYIIAKIKAAEILKTLLEPTSVEIKNR